MRQTTTAEVRPMKAKHRVPPPRGRVARHFGCQKVGSDRISCRDASVRGEITPDASGIRGISA
jgi:hypothetical protein